MSFFLSYNDWLEDIGGAAPQFYSKIGSVAKTFFCKLWNAYPDRITKSNFFPTGMARGFANNLCAPNNPPPPDIPPTCQYRCHLFGTYYSKNLSEGGCDKTAYWRTRAAYKPEEYLSFTAAEIGNGYWGIPLKSGQWSYIGVVNQSAYENRYIGSIAPVSLKVRTGQETCLNQAGSPAGYIQDPENADIVPVPPSATNCDDLVIYPPTYPPNPITYNTFIEAGDETQIVVNASVSLDVNGDIGFPVTINFGDFEVALDAGGFTFDFSINNKYLSGNEYGGNSNIFLNERPPELEPPEPPEPPVENSQSFGSANARIASINNGPLTRVKILVDKSTARTNAQYGGGAPDIYFVGWFEFRSGDYNYPREPIHFLSNTFIAPANADGFAYTLLKGAMGTSTAYYLEETA